MLETVSATAIENELPLKGSRSQIDRSAEENVEVLERDRLHVTMNDAVQCLQRRPRRAAVPNAFEVGVQIDGMIVQEGLLPRNDSSIASSVETSIEPYYRKVGGMIEMEARIARADEPFCGPSATAVM